jgi:hypothetical protein
MNKIEFIKAIRQFIADGKTDEALALMQKEVSQFDPSLVTDATLLGSRYTTATNDCIIKNILPRDAYDLTVAQINYALLEIVEKLEKDAPLSTSTAKNKNSGRILHNIPGIMPIGKERRCIVRIAYDDESLLRDLKVDENTTIENVRIAEVMGVELVDFNETPAFTIRTLNEAEQFISDDDYTQWLFMVKALREGKYPLTLKVAVIEQINGKERKRDIVLEKEVFIITNIEEPPAAAAPTPASVKTAQEQPSATHFEDSSIRFNYVVSEDNGAAVTSSTPSKRFSMSGLMSTIGVIVMAMVGWVSFQTFSNQGGSDIVLTDDKNNPNKPNNGSNGGSNSGSNGSTSTDTLNALPNTQMNQPNQLAAGGENKEPAGENKVPHVDGIKEKKEVIVQAVPQPQYDKEIKYVEQKQKAATYSKPPVKVNKVPKQPTKPKIKIGDVKLTPSSSPSPLPTTPVDVVKEEKLPMRTLKVKLILKGEMKKAAISIDGQSVDKYLKKNIFGTPQYIEFKSNKERHTITFKRGNVSCSLTDVLVQNGEITVEPCSFE